MMGLFGSSSAYVHATDLFFATLTVREHLTFHGMVRVPSSVPVEERLQVRGVRGVSYD